MLDWILNAVLILVCFVVAFLFLKRRDEEAAKREREKALAAAARKEAEEEEVIEKPYTLKELGEFDGSDENTPILVAVNYKVYDVTKGKAFYGKGGSYEALAGRDASRALATMDMSGKSLSSEWDELSDLGGDEWGTLKDWERSFSIKYKCVGWLEKEPGQDSTENEGGDKPVVKEAESVGPIQKEERISDPSEDDPPQNGQDESQPDDQPAEESEAHVKDSVEQSHDQTEHSNNQSEKVDDQDQAGPDDQDQQQDQIGQDDQDQQKDQIDKDDQDKDDQDKHQDKDQDNQDQQQDEISQSPEATEVGNQEENQEADKNDVETSQGDQEQDENSM